jgi:hypothetical protein
VAQGKAGDKAWDHPLAERRAGPDEVLIDVPARHADAVLAALRGDIWLAEDTGQTVTTDDGEDHMATLRLRRRAGSTLPNPAAPVPPRREPEVQGALYAPGDFVVGEGVQLETPLFAEGSVTLRRGASVFGTLVAGGDVVLEEGATAGDVFAGGAVRKAATATTGAIVARRGTTPPSPPRAAPSGRAEAAPSLAERIGAGYAARKQLKGTPTPRADLEALLRDARAWAGEAAERGDAAQQGRADRLAAKLLRDIEASRSDGAQR